MEGVRGGRLVDLPAEAVETLKALRPEESAVSWAFRFLQSVPGVTDGCSPAWAHAEQVEENSGHLGGGQAAERGRSSPP